MARWLTCTVVLLILYGSFFPFQFVSFSHWHLLEAMHRLHFTRPSRGDLVANFLLYMPLGLCLTRTLPRHWSRLGVFGVTVVCGTLLSHTIELLQIFASERVSSLTDMAVNATGTTLGAVIGLLYGTMDVKIPVPGMAQGRAEPVPLGVLVLWLACRLAPFIPTIDWQKYKMALKPLLLHPQLTAEGVFRYTIAWLIVIEAVRQIWKREYTARAALGIVASVLLGCLVVIDKSFSANEIVALTLLVPVAGIRRLLPERVYRVAVALSLAVVIVVQGLQPWRFLAYPQTFSWVPFQNFLSGSIEVNYVVFLEKCFWYTALVWLLTRAGIGVYIATALTTLLLLMIEIVQVWLPDRLAEITDPLLAVVAGICVALLGTSVTRESTITGSRPRQ